MKKPVHSISSTCPRSASRRREPKNRRTIVHRKIKYSAIVPTGFRRKPAGHCMGYLCRESALGGVRRCFCGPVLLFKLLVQAADDFVGDVQGVSSKQHVAGLVVLQHNTEAIGLSIFLQI